MLLKKLIIAVILRLFSRKKSDFSTLPNNFDVKMHPFDVHRPQVDSFQLSFSFEGWLSQVGFDVGHHGSDVPAQARVKWSDRYK